MYVKKCFMCGKTEGRQLYFRINYFDYIMIIGLYGNMWVHGICLKAFYQYLSAHSVQYDPNIPNNQRDDNGTIIIEQTSFVNLCVQSCGLIPADVTCYKNCMDTLLQSVLPSPSSSLRIISKSKCFHCHQFGGFMAKCRFSRCGYMFHLVCMKSLTNNTMENLILSNGIVCKLHKNRSIEETDRTIQQPKYSTLSLKPKGAVDSVSSKPLVVIASSANVVNPTNVANVVNPTNIVNPANPANPANPQHLSKQESTSSGMTDLQCGNANEEMVFIQEKENIENNATDTSLLSVESSEAVTSELAKEDEVVDDGEICDICHNGYSVPEDMLVFCDKCNVPVHQSCYGIEKVPEGEWMCSVCRQGLSPSFTVCAVCHKSNGAMYRTPDNKWVHLICTFFIPELSFDYSGPEILVNGFSLISKERAALCCCICRKNGGGCTQCSCRSCVVAYHPYCALKSGLIVTFKQVGDQIQYISYCKFHSEKKRMKEKKEQASKEGDSNTSTPKKKRRGPNRKRKAKEDTQLIPSSMLQKISNHANNETSISCTDFWKLIKY